MQPRLMHHPARLAGASLLRLQSDDRLVSLAREGHDPAYSAIVDRYRAPLLRYCTRLLGQGRAEDAVQQAFVNAHHAMKTSENDDIQLRPWLYRIAHNASLNILRSDHDHAQLDPERAGAAGVEEAVELRDRLHETLTAIQSLPAAQRDALLLRELEGRSHVEIAAALGVTAGSARQHLMRARASLRSAVTAITPYPLLIKLAGAMTSDPMSGRVTEAVAGAGIVATVAKVSAGVLATGAIAGAVAGGELPVPGVTPHRATTEHRADAATQPRAARTPTTIDDRGGARETFHRHGGRGSAGHGEQGDDHGGHGTSGDGHGGSGSPAKSGGSDDSGTSGSDDSGKSGKSGSDDSGTSGGPGTPGTSGGSDDPAGDGHGGPGTQGSDGLLDTSGSGGSGSQGSGSPVTTTTTGSDDGHSGSPSSDSSGSGSSGSDSSGSGSSGSGSSGSGDTTTTTVPTAGD